MLNIVRFIALDNNIYIKNGVAIIGQRSEKYLSSSVWSFYSSFPSYFSFYLEFLEGEDAYAHRRIKCTRPYKLFLRYLFATETHNKIKCLTVILWLRTNVWYNTLWYMISVVRTCYSYILVRYSSAIIIYSAIIIQKGEKEHFDDFNKLEHIVTNAPNNFYLYVLPSFGCNFQDNTHQV